jgi:hypothetical protein
VDGVPEHLHSQCSKDGLAVVFAKLAGRGFLTDKPLMASLYGANLHSVQEKGHWVEVIASIFKKGDTVDRDIGDALKERLTLRSSSLPLVAGTRLRRAP